MDIVGAFAWSLDKKKPALRVEGGSGETWLSDQRQPLAPHGCSVVIMVMVMAVRPAHDTAAPKGAKAAVRSV